MDLKKKYGLIGFPLNNSFSVNYFTQKFSEFGEAYSYENYPISDIVQLKSFLSNPENLSGFNVTKPYKEKVIPYLQSLSAEAQACGAVNCIEVSKNGDLIGHNTDVYGFKSSLLAFIGSNQNMRALVIGNGGASKAVCYALKQLNIPFSVAARNGLGDYLLTEIDKEVIQAHRLIIQTTPIGMFPNTAEELPFSLNGVGKEHFCYDLIYLPEETSFLKTVKLKGAKTLNGLKMLHLQADEAHSIWMNSKT
jgi:shikimate dehydrogenase